MKVRKDGTVALSKGERRAGNFVVSMDDTHVRIRAVSGSFSLRIARTLTMGNLLAQAMQGDVKTLELLCAWIYKVSSIVPDAQAMTAVAALYEVLPVRLERRQGRDAALYAGPEDFRGRMMSLLPAMGVDVTDAALTDALTAALDAHYASHADYYERIASDIGTDALRDYYARTRKEESHD